MYVSVWQHIVQRYWVSRKLLCELAARRWDRHPPWLAAPARAPAPAPASLTPAPAPAPAPASLTLPSIVGYTSQVVRAQAIEQMRSDIDQHRMRVERVAPGPLHTKTTSVPPLRNQTSAEREAAADKEAAELQAGSATAAGVAMPASSLEGVEQAAAAANTEPC